MTEETSNPWAISVRLKHYNSAKTRFQINHDYRIGDQPNYVDLERSHLNTHGFLKMDVAEYRKTMLERRKLTNPKRAANLDRAAIMTGGIITFGHLAQREVLALSRDDQNAMFGEIGRTIIWKLDNEKTAQVIHRDEEAIHSHFQMPSRRLSDGRLMSEVLSPAMMSEIQDIAATVAQRWCPKIERGKPKEKTGARNKNVAQLHRTAAQDYDELIKKIDAAREKAAAAKKRRDTNVQRAWNARKKAKTNAAAADKHLKNAQTYEKRAADAQEAIQSLTEELETLEGQLEALRASEASLRRSVDAQKAELEAVEQAVAQKKNESAQLDREAEQLESEIAILERGPAKGGSSLIAAQISHCRRKLDKVEKTNIGLHARLKKLTETAASAVDHVWYKLSTVWRDHDCRINYVGNNKRTLTVHIPNVNDRHIKPTEHGWYGLSTHMARLGITWREYACDYGGTSPTDMKQALIAIGYPEKGLSDCFVPAPERKPDSEKTQEQQSAPRPSPRGPSGPSM